MSGHKFLQYLRVEGIGFLVALTATVPLYTGFAKLLSPAAFREALLAQSLIPEPIVSQVAWGVILLEIVIGTSALWHIAGKGIIHRAVLMLASLFALFALYAGAMILFPPPAPTGCGCTGSDVTDIADWGAITWRNAATAALLLVALPLTTDRLNAQTDTTEPPTPCAQTRH